MIVARSGATYARPAFQVGPGGGWEIPVEVDFVAPFAASDRDAWECEYVDHVQREAARSLDCRDEPWYEDMAHDVWLDDAWVYAREEGLVEEEWAGHQYKYDVCRDRHFPGRPWRPGSGVFFLTIGSTRPGSAPALSAELKERRSSQPDESDRRLPTDEVNNLRPHAQTISPIGRDNEARFPGQFWTVNLLFRPFQNSNSKIGARAAGQTQKSSRVMSG